MIERIRKSLNEGYRVIKWVVSFLAERARAETSIAKLLYEISRLERKMDDLYIELGKRTVELKEKGEVAVFSDFIIQQISAEINGLQEMVNEHKEKAKILNKLPE